MNHDNFKSHFLKFFKQYAKDPRYSVPVIFVYSTKKEDVETLGINVIEFPEKALTDFQSRDDFFTKVLPLIGKSIAREGKIRAVCFQALIWTGKQDPALPYKHTKLEDSPDTKYMVSIDSAEKAETLFFEWGVSETGELTLMECAAPLPLNKTKAVDLYLTLTRQKR